jgi:hypothetical protein
MSLVFVLFLTNLGINLSKKRIFWAFIVGLKPNMPVIQWDTGMKGLKKLFYLIFITCLVNEPFSVITFNK